MRTFRAPECYSSGALDREIESIDDARDGAGGTGGPENCLNFQGLRCDVCYRECPKIDEAITPELERNTRTGKHARFLADGSQRRLYRLR